MGLPDSSCVVHAHLMHISQLLNSSVLMKPQTHPTQPYPVNINPVSYLQWVPDMLLPLK